MISINEGLQFLQHLCGEYRGVSQQMHLRIWPCGHGVAVEWRTVQGVQLVGVVGAARSALELYAQIGLPNVVRFAGDKSAPHEVCLNALEPPLCLRLYQEAGIVHFSLNWAGKDATVLRFQKVSEPL